MGKWSVVSWSVDLRSVDLMKPRKKHVWNHDFACAMWSRFILFFYFYFFSLLKIKKSKLNYQRQSLESLAIPKIHKYYNKTKPRGISPNIYFFYKKLLQAFLKSICVLLKNFSWETHHRSFLRSVTTSFGTVTLQNTTHFWYFFHYSYC